VLKKIISGFQTGADIAAIDAALSCGFPYGGWVPKGRRTINGPLDEKYIALEMPTTGYPPRTRKNIISSSGTIIFTHGPLSGGSALTRNISIKEKKPWLHLDMTRHSEKDAVEKILFWIELNNIVVLNVAGKSGHKNKKIYAVVFNTMRAVLEKI